MKQIAIIGLGSFGKRILDELNRFEIEVLIVDKDPLIIDQYKDKAGGAFAADVTNFETLKRVLPEVLDVVIIDFEDNIEASILVTSHCRKLGIHRIVAKAQSEEHGDILDIVGATRVVFPDREAAKRLTPQFLSSQLLNYLPISSDLVIAEVGIPERLVGKTSLEANLRKEFDINVIAVRPGQQEDFQYFSPEYKFGPEDVAIVAGNEDRIVSFTGSKPQPAHRKNAQKVFGQLFPKRKGGKAAKH
jgi:trk system potassium uptake protein TrkA